jgi:hypothetical protein
MSSRKKLVPPEALLLPTSMKFESNIKKKAGNHQPQKKEIYKVFFINTAYTLTLIQRHH